MFRFRLSLLAGTVALAAAPGLALATTTFGTLGNFDAVNDTGSVAHGFEIDLEGLHSSDILDTFGGPGRGFPPTVERYGAPLIQDYTSGSIFGVHVIYQSGLTGGAWDVGTPTGIYSTPGESCWTGGGGGYGPSTPCDHFGVSTRGAPTKTTYSWLVESTPGSTTLTGATSTVLTPQWTVTPAAPPPPGQPPAPPVVMAQIAAPAADQPDHFGQAIWVKVLTTEFDSPIDLRELVNDNAKVQAAQVETEWQLLQNEYGNPLSGLLEQGGEVGAGSESVLRKYEYFDYTGAVDPLSGEALPALGDTNPGPG